MAVVMKNLLMLLFRQGRGLIADQEEIDQRCTRSMFTGSRRRPRPSGEGVRARFQVPWTGRREFNANGTSQQVETGASLATDHKVLR